MILLMKYQNTCKTLERSGITGNEVDSLTFFNLVFRNLREYIIPLSTKEK